MNIPYLDLKAITALHGEETEKAVNAVVSSGSAELWDCKNCIVHVDGLRRVVLDALDGYIVAERDGRLLVCPLSDEQKIREFSSKQA